MVIAQRNGEIRNRRTVKGRKIMRAEGNKKKKMRFKKKSKG